MLSKSHIAKAKQGGSVAVRELLESQSNAKGVVYVLENLGRMPEDIDAEWLQHFLKNDNKQIRLWVVKTLGKLKDEAAAPQLMHMASEDASTEVRREAVSAIGRFRSAKFKHFLLRMLDDRDPKIVCQAIRGLLIFKGDEGVDVRLKALAEHENEMVKTVIHREYFRRRNLSRTAPPHPASPRSLQNVVVNGDVRSVLAAVPNESFHLTFTSPPYYNARDYSIYQSYQAYLDFLQEVFRLTHDKTKEGRFLIVNTSPVIVPRVSRQHSSIRYPIPFDLHNVLVEMDWEFIDDIVWVKPEASVKNRVGGFLQHRKPLGYKPNAVTEYLMVYRKRTSKLLDWNIRQYGQETLKASLVAGEFETTNVWQIDPTYNKAHSAVFPLELCERVLRYYSYVGDLVFDPFGGSGTFGVMANRMNRRFFMTEQDTDYFKHIQKQFRQRNLSNHQPLHFLKQDEFKKAL